MVTPSTVTGEWSSVTEHRFPFSPGPVTGIVNWAQARHVSMLKARMPYIITILSDPLLDEEDLDPRKLNDANAIYERIQYLLLAERSLGPDSAFPLYHYACDASRRSVPYVEGGPAPADDYSDIWDVIIPGGVNDDIRVSKVAIIEEDDPELKRVYTITGIGQDRLKYIARLTMEDYGLRRP